MKQKRFLGFLPALSLVALPLFGANKLDLVDDQAQFGDLAEVALNLETTDQVQGVVAVLEWDDTNVAGEALVVAAALADADTVVTRVESSFIILGVVMDSDPNDAGSPEILQVPEDGDPAIHLATAQLRCGAGPGESTTRLEFVDGVHATVDGGPALDNIVVIGGLSIGGMEGLVLDGADVRCIAEPDSLTIESGSNEDPAGNVQACGDVRILMTNKAPVQGFVTAVCHNDPNLELTAISLGAAAPAADFSAFEIDPFVGGTFGVVLDLNEPIGDVPDIGPGSGQHIATYTYCCRPLPPPGAEVVTNLEFCDMTLGDPLKENLIVVGGRSISAPVLELNNGTFTCKGAALLEDCENGEDDDGDGDVDCADSDCATFPACLGQSFLCGPRDLSDSNENGIADAVGSRNGTVEVCFFVLSQEDNAVGQHMQFDHIQGFSMAVSYCCDLQAREVFDISGTILEALGAEFVSIQADNVPLTDPDGTATPGDLLDDDGCELIIGVLVDALPPFEGTTIPPAPDPQRVGCVTFDILESAECDSCCPIEFVNGLNGRGRVPIRNLMSLENKSFGPNLVPCEACIKDEERFFRGDCNFSLGGTFAVDISDAQAVVSYLFLPGSWQFEPPCLDACDCQDDGRVDLADTVCILQYLFQFGRVPPPPGPGWDPAAQAETPLGLDPTPDKLDCLAGRNCELIPD